MWEQLIEPAGEARSLFEVLRRVDVEEQHASGIELRHISVGHGVHATGGEDVRHAQFASIESRLDEPGDGPAIRSAERVPAAIDSRDDGISAVDRAEPSQQRRTDKRHVTSEDQDDGPSGEQQARVHAAQRTCTRHDIRHVTHTLDA